MLNWPAVRRLPKQQSTQAADQPEKETKISQDSPTAGHDDVLVDVEPTGLTEHIAGSEMTRNDCRNG